MYFSLQIFKNGGGREVEGIKVLKHGTWIGAVPCWGAEGAVGGVLPCMLSGNPEHVLITAYSTIVFIICSINIIVVTLMQ